MNQSESSENCAQQLLSEAEVIYWLSRSPRERLVHLGVLRCEAYFAEQAGLGNYPVEMPRMRKDVLTIVQSKDKH